MNEIYTWNSNVGYLGSVEQIGRQQTERQVTLENSRRWHFLYFVNGDNIHRIKRAFSSEFIPVVDVISAT